jgi:hypothetical protein
MFTSDGTALSDDFQVSGVTGASDSSVTALPDGRFLIAFTRTVGTQEQVGGVVRDADATEDGTGGATVLGNGLARESALATLTDGRVIVVTTSPSPPTLNDTSGTAVTGLLVEPRESGVILVGKDLDDEWIGTDFGDVMKGGGGSDNITSGSGQDSVFGQGGDDILRGRSQSILEGGEGADQLFGAFGTFASYEHSDAGVTISLYANFANGGHASGDTLHDIFNLAGSAFGDVLAGNDSLNMLVGLDGDDTLKGGGGSDNLGGGAGNDSLLGGADFDVALYTGNLGDYAITLADGDHIRIADQRPGSPDGTDTLSGIEMVGFEGDFHFLSSLLPPAPVPDVVWGNSNGVVEINDNVIGVMQSGDHYAGSGDFDDDGDSDLLWRNDDGTVMLTTLADGLNESSYDLAVVSTTWQIRGTGDFDGDGDADILWHRDNGQVTTWEMEDAALVTNHNLPGVSNGWAIAGTGDFDADGDADILWRGNGGQVVTWEMEDGAYVVNHNLATASASWQVRGTGDFDADGDADILWQHNGGQVVTWEMEDGALVTNHNLPNVSSGWQIQGVEDFENDGDADILFRRTSGEVVTWEMEDGTFVQNHNYGVVWNEWRILGTGEFDLV